MKRHGRAAVLFRSHHFGVILAILNFPFVFQAQSPPWIFCLIQPLDPVSFGSMKFSRLSWVDPQKRRIRAWKYKGSAPSKTAAPGELLKIRGLIQRLKKSSRKPWLGQRRNFTIFWSRFWLFQGRVSFNDKPFTGIFDHSVPKAGFP